ncbi:hypothetical protein W677_02653, partial [Staphylococcus aureus VET0467R]
RRAGQVMNRSMLTLDIDYAAQDMTDILSMFYDFAYCLYSTHRNYTNKQMLDYTDKDKIIRLLFIIS